MSTKNQGLHDVNLYSDNRLMEDVKEGNVEKMAVLFEKHHVSLFNFFMRLTGNRNIRGGQEVQLMRQALAQLPLKKREVLILSRYQNLKYKEIAELMDCHIGTVKAHVHRAIKELGKIYFELQGGTVS